MKQLFTARATPAVVTGFLVLLAAGGGYAVAARGGTSTIKACVDHTTHVLYAPPCAKHDRKISWNQLGRTGAPGAPGAPGAQGAQGNPGPSGPSGTVSVTQIEDDQAGVVTGNTPQFITRTATVVFADARTAAVVSGTVDLGSSTSTTVNSDLGVCYQPAAGGPVTFASFVIPQIQASSSVYYAQSVSGAVGNLPAGTYLIGLCADNESPTLLHGLAAGTVTVSETLSGTTYLNRTLVIARHRQG